MFQAMPVTPVPRPVGHPFTVGDLTAADFIEATCPGCHAVTRTGAWQLLLRYSAATVLKGLEGHMRCRRCGRTGPQPWHVMRASPPLAMVPESPLQAARRKRLEEARAWGVTDEAQGENSTWGLWEARRGAYMALVGRKGQRHHRRSWGAWAALGATSLKQLSCDGRWRR